MSKLAETRTRQNLAAVDATTDRIMDAVVELLVDHKPNELTIDEIARRASVARVTVYRRFPDRDSIVVATAMRESMRLFDRIEAAIAETPDPEERIVESFVVVMELGRKHPMRRHALGEDPSALLPPIDGRKADLLALGRSWLETRLLKGRRDAAEVAELAVRIVVSLLFRPESEIALDTPDELRRFARTHLVPLIDPTRTRYYDESTWADLG